MENLCIGTAQFGSSYGIANKQGKPTAIEVEKIVKIALEDGVQYFDTAQAYGESESVLGEALLKSEFDTRLKVITKLSPEYRHQSIIRLRESIQSSLKKLNLNTLWGVLLHRVLDNEELKPFFESAEALKKEGLIQNIGVSVYEPEEALLFARDPRIDVIQVPVNIFDRRLFDNNFFETAAHNRKIVFARSVYLQGLLLLEKHEIVEKKMAWVMPIMEKYYEFIKDRNLEKRVFCLKALTARIPDVKIVLGVENSSQLKQNIEVLNSGLLKQSIVDEWWSGLPLLPVRLLNPAKW